MEPGGHIRNRPPTMGGGLSSLAPSATQSTRPRGLSSFVKPREETQLELLAQALARGLDPQVAQAEYARITGGVEQRFDEFRDRRRSRRQMDELLGGLPPGVEEAAQMSQLGVPAGIIESVYAQGLGGAGVQLDDEDSTNVIAAASAQINAARESGQPADFQSIFWGGLARQLAQSGFVGPEFEAAKELLQTSWSRLGGEPGPSQAGQGLSALGSTPSQPPVFNRPPGVPTRRF